MTIRSGVIRPRSISWLRYSIISQGISLNTSGVTPSQITVTNPPRAQVTDFRDSRPPCRLLYLICYQYAPTAAWAFDCCFGLPVEWDIRNSVGAGVLVGEIGVFGFSSLPRLITESTGFFHTWRFDSQTDITVFGAGNGVEVPDVLRPPITVPEPTTLALLVLGLLGVRVSRNSGHPPAVMGIHA